MSQGQSTKPDLRHRGQGRYAIHVWVGQRSLYTQEEATETLKAIEEMFNAIPKTRRMEYIGHLNDVCLFIEAVTRAAPNEKP